MSEFPQPDLGSPTQDKTSGCGQTAWVAVERSEQYGRHFWHGVIDALADLTSEGTAVERVAPAPDFIGEPVRRLLSGHESLDEPVILEATLVLEEDDPRELAKRMQKQWIIKRANQPMGHQCAGCIFKNPRGASAGELIEKSGLKGTRIGGAVVSERHANFIIAEPDCTSQDVLRLIELIRGQVRDRVGIELELELEIW